MLNPISLKYWELCHPPENLGAKTSSSATARCDICGDSKHNKRKKRLALFTKPALDIELVKCHNCGYCEPFGKYIKDFHPDLYQAYNNERRSDSLSYLQREANIKQASTQFQNSDVTVKSTETGVTFLEVKVNTKNTKGTKGTEGEQEWESQYQWEPPQTPNILKINTKGSNFKPPPVVFQQPKEIKSMTTEAISFIKNRGFNKELISFNMKNNGLKLLFATGEVEVVWVYEGKINKKKINLRDNIIIPFVIDTPTGLMWYGFYARSIYEKKFHIFSPPENSGFKAWGWFNAINSFSRLKPNEPLYIFEGIFDACTIGSVSIAQLGVSLSEERLIELQHSGIDRVFVYDNDSAGREAVYKMCKQGEKVFIWPKEYQGLDISLFKDINEMLSKGISSEFIKDMINNNTFEGVLGTSKLLLEGW